MFYGSCRLHFLYTYNISMLSLLEKKLFCAAPVLLCPSYPYLTKVRPLFTIEERKQRSDFPSSFVFYFIYLFLVFVIQQCTIYCRKQIQRKFVFELKYLAERGFDPRTSGLWAQHASTAPLCCRQHARFIWVENFNKQRIASDF